MSSLWLKNPAAIWLGDGVDADARGGVLIRDGKIVEHIKAGAQPSQPSDEVFDATDKIILPGLINCHHHFYQTLTRAYPAALNKELFEWLVNLYPVWAGLDEECIALSTQLALAELMLSGCTLASDHHYLFNPHISQAIDIQAKVAEAMGMRVVLTRGSMSVGESNGGLPPDSVVQSEAAILEESERLITRYHQQGKGAMRQIALAPCSPFSVSPELMRHSAELARKNGVLLHTHLAETEDENAYCLKHFGLRPVDYLEKVGWLNNDVWLAHGIHFNENEVRRLGRAGVAISHCPSSNMILASGMAKTLELEAAGCPVGLGVDGSASNDASNLFEEVRQAFLLQRLHYGSARVSHLDALRWATTGGARLFRRDDVGHLGLGMCADIAIFARDALRFSGSHDPLASLVLCGANSVDSLLIAGQWRVKNGQLLGVDLDQLRAKHSEAAAKLVAKHR